ncbi:MAG: methyltransferase domain-containing protein [Anaerolineae bacterium]|nr:methyltransferase domain-containing protein [Anaerolineae bacterium]
MDTVTRFTSKAEKYAKYRWGYAAEAIQTILSVAHISAASVVADIGSGTGILTGQFVDKVQRVYAVEPNPEMRRYAEKALARYPSFCSIDGLSDATTLPDRSVDLITVGQALHWFVPETTKREFLRILKPGGWLAVLWKEGTDQTMEEAMRPLFTEQYGWNTSGTKQQPDKPTEFYYGGQDYLRMSYPQIIQEPWEAFFGALCSRAFAPDEDNPLYADFEKAVQSVFSRFSTGGLITVKNATELCLGQIGGV